MHHYSQYPPPSGWRDKTDNVCAWRGFHIPCTVLCTNTLGVNIRAASTSLSETPWKVPAASPCQAWVSQHLLGPLIQPPALGEVQIFLAVLWRFRKRGHSPHQLPNSTQRRLPCPADIRAPSISLPLGTWLPALCSLLRLQNPSVPQGNGAFPRASPQAPQDSPSAAAVTQQTAEKAQPPVAMETAVLL